MNPRDTSVEAQRVVAEIEARFTDLERLRILDQEFATGCALLRAGHRAQFPDEDDEQIEARVFRSLLGDELGARAWEERRRRAIDGRG